MVPKTDAGKFLGVILTIFVFVIFDEDPALCKIYIFMTHGPFELRGGQVRVVSAGMVLVLRGLEVEFSPVGQEQWHRIDFA